MNEKEIIINSISAEPADMKVLPDGRVVADAILVTIKATERTEINFLTLDLTFNVSEIK